MSTTPTLTLRGVGVTHPGRVRSNNEDAFCAHDGVFVVADGMGGHQAGEVASALAVGALVGGRAELNEVAELTTLVGRANAAILARAEQEPDHRGMGTTLTGLVVVGDTEQAIHRVAVVNVGDSRTYRWRSGTFEQLSTDHSYVQDLVASGMLTAEEARQHPRRNIVTRALGVESVVLPDVTEVDLLPGDRFIVCSDGLVDEVVDDDIAQVLRQSLAAGPLAETLVKMALDGGGRDNVTVVVVDVLELVDPVGPVGPVDPVDPVDPQPVAPPVSAPRRERTAVRRWLGVAAFFVGLVVVVGGTLVAVGAYARSGYFVDFDQQDDVVVVYQGRPGGVWWFDPTTVEITDVRRNDLGPVDIERISARPTFDARSDVTLYLSTVTTTTTTTTTVPG